MFSTPRAYSLQILKRRRMASMATPQIPQADLDSFADHLRKSEKILALCGAGLSASSGLPTFRGAGGLWRQYDATSLATPEAFGENPGLVWQFYSYRRHMALQASPNAAHYALAELARRKEDFKTLTQNVDGEFCAVSLHLNSIYLFCDLGLSPRAGHPARSLYLLHGSLFDVKCSSYGCSHFERNNFTDPIVPALAIPMGGKPPAPLGTAASQTPDGREAAAEIVHAPRELDISDDRVEIPDLEATNLPQCPQCHGLLRPGVVWFGEALPAKTMDEVDRFITESRKIDLMLVIGTSGQVYPAAGYVETAREKGAKVAVINMDPEGLPGRGRERRGVDWFFQGDASVILPQILKEEIGDVHRHMPQEQ